MKPKPFSAMIFLIVPCGILFDGFVRFDDVLGSGGLTKFSVPSYMGGKPYLNQTTVTQYRKEIFSSDHSLLRQLQNEGWKTGIFHKFYLFNSNQANDYITDVKQVGKQEKDLPKGEDRFHEFYRSDQSHIQIRFQFFPFEFPDGEGKRHTLKL